MGDKLDPCG